MLSHIFFPTFCFAMSLRLSVVFDKVHDSGPLVTIDPVILYRPTHKGCVIHLFLICGSVHGNIYYQQEIFVLCLVEQWQQNTFFLSNKELYTCWLCGSLRDRLWQPMKNKCGSRQRRWMWLPWGQLTRPTQVLSVSWPRWGTAQIPNFLAEVVLYRHFTRIKLSV